MTSKNNQEIENEGVDNKYYEKVTVIIPTYKRDVFYLSRAVESVLQQTYANIEVIVVDDSPSDYENRYQIKNYMNSLIKENTNVIYLQNEVNLGGSLARNRGIYEATGKYITFLDDDDKYKARKIEKQVAFMKAHDYDMTFSNMVMYNNAGRIVDKREYRDIPAFDNESLLKYHLMKHMTGTPTFMYKAEKLREIGGFKDAKMGQEFYLMLKSIEHNLMIGYIDDCDVIVYKHDGEAISQGKNKIIGEKKLYEFKKKYFPILSNKEKRFIRFRHYAVMVVAYKRNSMYFKAIIAGITALLSSPIDFVEQVSGYIYKITLK